MIGINAESEQISSQGDQEKERIARPSGKSSQDIVNSIKSMIKGPI
jgi:hypothetical protein